MTKKIIINYQKGNVEEYLNKSLEEQLFSYFHKHHCNNDWFVQLDVTDKNIVLSKFSKSIGYSGGHFFCKRTDHGKFIYNRSEKKVKCNTFSKCDVLSALTHFSQFDWLKVSQEQDLVVPTLFCDSIVRDILLGKLTNPESIVKKYLSLNKIKGVNWRTFVKYLKCCHIPVKWILCHTTDCTEAMELLMSKYQSDPYDKIPAEKEKQFEKSRIFYDLFMLAMALNKKIDPKWSLSRMKEEHTKMTRKLTEKDLAEKEQIDIYAGCPEFDYPCKLLSTEGEVFIESKEMENCIYFYYWDWIKDHRYLVFSFNYPERFTLVLKLTDKGWTFDQTYMKNNNKNISGESKKMIDKFLNDPKVQETLDKLKKGDVLPEQDDFQDDDWLNAFPE